MNDILNRTLYSEWVDFVEVDGKVRPFKCKKCKTFGGKLKHRRVTERTGGEHKEYKVECDICGHNTGVYWSKILAESTWDAEHDPYYDGQKAVRAVE